MDNNYNNRMQSSGKQRGRPRKDAPEMVPLETEKVVTLAMCQRCGRQERPTVDRVTPDGRQLHFCKGCGDYSLVGQKKRAE